MPQGRERLLNTKEAMERMGLSQSQLARLRDARRISFYKRAGRIFYAPEEVERVLKTFEVCAIDADPDAGARRAPTIALTTTATPTTREVAR